MTEMRLFCLFHSLLPKEVIFASLSFHHPNIMGIRHRQVAEKKYNKTSDYSNRAFRMGSADDIEQGSSNLRNTHPQVKQIMGSYQVRRRLSLAGIGIALIFVVAVVTFATARMKGE